MARSAKSRNTRSTRKPVTIDLEAEVVAEDNNEVSDTNENSSQPDVTETASDEIKVDGVDDMPENNEPKKADVEEGVLPQPVAAPSKAGGITGGVIGGVLALLGGAGLQWGGVLPNFGPQSEVGQIDLTPLQNEISDLKGQISILQKKGVTTTAMPVGAQKTINSAMNSASKALANVEIAGEKIEALNTKIGNVEKKLASGGGSSNAGLNTLSTRISKLENKMFNSTGTASPELTSTISALEEKLGSVETNLTEQSKSITQWQSTMDTQVKNLGEKLAATEEKIADGTSGSSVAVTIASAGLKSAIDRGGSFMAELEAYASVAGNTDAVAELRNHAATGVETVNQLSDQFSSVANRIIAVGNGVSDDAGIMERLSASARSLVQVRPVGEVEGETPGAITARIETRLKDGDLTAALSEWEALPEEAKTISAQFYDKMRARQSVDTLVAKALSGAMAATAQTSN